MLERCMAANAHDGILSFLRRMHNSILQDARKYPMPDASLCFICRAESTHVFRPLDRSARPPLGSTVDAIVNALLDRSGVLLQPKLIECAANLCVHLRSNQAQQIRSSSDKLSYDVLIHAERLISQHAHTRDGACCVAIINLLSACLERCLEMPLQLPATLMWVSKMVVDCSKDTHGKGTSVVHSKAVKLLLDVCDQNSSRAGLWTVPEVQQCAAFKDGVWQRWQRKPVHRNESEHLHRLQRLYYYVPQWKDPAAARAVAAPAANSPNAAPSKAGHTQRADYSETHEYTGRGSASAVIDQVSQAGSSSKRPRISPPRQRPSTAPAVVSSNEPGLLQTVTDGAKAVGSGIANGAKALGGWLFG